MKIDNIRHIELAYKRVAPHLEAYKLYDVDTIGDDTCRLKSIGGRQ